MSPRKRPTKKKCVSQDSHSYSCSAVERKLFKSCLEETVTEEFSNDVPEETNMYWSEIASLCVDGESLRLQKVLLRKLLNREKILRASDTPTTEDISALKGLVAKTKTTFRCIAMLEAE